MKTNHLILIILVAVGFLYLFLFLQQQNKWELPAGTPTVDKRTEELCHWYASRDHEKELAPERWQWFKDQGIDLNKDFDWYTSCIDHQKYPVAKAEKPT